MLTNQHPVNNSWELEQADPPSELWGRHECLEGLSPVPAGGNDVTIDSSVISIYSPAIDSQSHHLLAL